MLIVFTVKQSPQWIIPIVFATVIDKLDNPDSISDRGLIILLIATAASMGGNIPLHTYYITQLSQITRRLERRLRQALAVRLQQLSIPYHDDTESGKLQAKVLRDVEQVHMISHHLGEAGVTIMMSIFWIIIYTGIRKPAVLLVYLVMVPVVIALRQIFSNRIRKENRAFRQKVEKMNSEVSQMIEMIPVSRAHGIEDVATHRATSEFNRVKDQGQRLDKLNALFQSSSWVTFQVANLMIFLVFAYLCYLDQISLGEVVLFEQLFRQIMMSFNMIMGIYPQLAKGLESIRSIGEVLECPDMEENQGKIPIDQVTGRIEYQNLGYTYRGETLPALSNIHLTIEPGECVAVVGPSGGGKSTLMRLTIGFRRPTAGKIVLDGIDMENIDMRTWRRFISVVPQESVLFEGSIRDNILFGLSSIEEEHFEDILQASNVREFVDKLPHGLDTMVGESGARLSGGQRQRLAIARALVRDPRVIVLDEPTSALDVMSEKYVQEAIDRLVKDRTTLIVAHRLSTIRNADRIVVLEDGKIVEMGTYAELIAKPDGAFKHMKDLQE
jgi:ATP-binding cassette subfamily B protein